MDDWNPAAHTFWSLLDEPSRSALTAAGRRSSFSARTHLVRQNEESDHVYVVRTGCVKVYTDSETGYQAVLAIRSPGDLLGEQAGFEGRPRSASLYALTDVEALVVPSARFLALTGSLPVVANAVRLVLSRRLRDADRRRAAAGAERVEARLAALLLELGELYGSRADGGSVRIDLPLTQDDMAGLVLTSRRTVSRVLEEWRGRGLVITGRQAIVVARSAELRRCAGHSSSQE
ncbi:MULTISPECIES: Crp/Fnr family transcriptional regulator [Streptomyces]|uniref:Crp/Fnr family transcriptional regulator n=1 Tax=Streptomyces silvisoli TaxID=3034235 RepID=A0ABT5ZM17_9ACTN|nr:MULTISPECIES: Crp/Fnr family transcriptional regulator [Streptomyces]MDF3290721.1 Crp/Fnr family transcriptional regulator [Streptomyces silvisoli]